MTPADKPAFVAALVGACEVTGAELSEAGFGLWWSLVEPHPIEAFAAAIRAHLADPDHGQFMPKPAEILARINQGGQTKRAIRDQAERAWANVQHGMQRAGGNRAVRFDDPAIVPAIRAAKGGWRPLCESRDMDATRRAFLAAYDPQRTEPGTVLGPQGQYDLAPLRIGCSSAPRHQLRASDTLQDAPGSSQEGFRGGNGAIAAGQGYRGSQTLSGLIQDLDLEGEPE
jgi:hypothetical protein